MSVEDYYRRVANGEITPSAAIRREWREAERVEDWDEGDDDVQ